MNKEGNTHKKNKSKQAVIKPNYSNNLILHEIEVIRTISNSPADWKILKTEK